MIPRTDDSGDIIAENTIATAIRAGEEMAASHLTAKVIELDAARGLSGLIVPDGYELQRLERFIDRPAAKRGHCTFNDAASFARYINAHKGAGTAISYEVDKPAMVAYLDHHEPNQVGESLTTHGLPGHALYSASLLFRPSREMTAWRGIDGKAQTQIGMAEFLEEHAEDVAQSSGTSLLEIVQRFEDTRSARFASAVDLHSGEVDVAFAVKDAAPGTSKARFPRDLTLGLPPFMGDDRFEVRARLRYRVDAASGALAITISLVRIDDVIEAAVRDRVSKVAALTAIEPYFGTLSGAGAHKA